MKKVAIYSRVSTNKQTVDNQKQELERVANQMNWTITGWYEDQGISGSKSDRPQFNELMKKVVQREIDIVAAWSVCRLGRSLTDLVNFLNQLYSRKIDLYLHKQGIDTSTPSGKAMFQMMGIFAEFERDIISERVKAGLARSKSQGTILGRPKIIDKVAKQVLELRQKNFGMIKIAKQLKIGTGTVQKVLKSHMVDTQKKSIDVKLWLRVENNSKFVRGKNKVRRDIEYYILSEFNMKKEYKDSWNYELTIPYKDSEDLDKKIYDMLDEIHSEADIRNCFIEADVYTADGEKSW